jgi:hypothetical protein
MVNGQLIGIESKTNLLLVGYLRNQPAEPYERGQMKYKIVIELETDRNLSAEELTYLEGSLELQIVEPQDFNGDDLDWVANSFEIGMNLND